MKNGEIPLKRIYESFSPRVLAELFRKAPDLTKKGLEELLSQYPDDFKNIVPQAFDGQTGLYNRIYFERVLLSQSIDKANENKVPLAYLLLDLDKFHDFNEKYGYAKGHEAIKLFAELLEKDFRTKIRRTKDTGTTEDKRKLNDRRKHYTSSFDYTARVPDALTHQGRVGGGEEFAVILYGANEEDAFKAANRFLENVRKIKIPYGKGQNLIITASGGVSQYKEGMTPEELKENAEIALRYSKNQGRDRITKHSALPKLI